MCPCYRRRTYSPPVVAKVNQYSPVVNTGEYKKFIAQKLEVSCTLYKVHNHTLLGVFCIQEKFATFDQSGDIQLTCILGSIRGHIVAGDFEFCSMETFAGNFSWTEMQLSWKLPLTGRSIRGHAVATDLLIRSLLSTPSAPDTSLGMSRPHNHPTTKPVKKMQNIWWQNDWVSMLFQIFAKIFGKQFFVIFYTKKQHSTVGFSDFSAFTDSFQFLFVIE